MTRFFCVALLLLLLFSVNSFAEDKKYLCVADKATGFALRNGNWVSTDFNVSDKRYILSLSSEKGKESVYVWKNFGSETGYDCEENEYGIFCNSFERVVFSKKTNRYIIFYYVGYVHGDDGYNSDTPSIEIGKCSSI